MTTRPLGCILSVDPGPDPLGAQEELSAAWDQLEQSAELSIAVLSLNGRLQTNPAPDEMLGWRLDALPLSTGKPVIAAIEGECLGFCFELALACDLRVAGEGATFGLSTQDVAYRVASVLLPRHTFVGLSLELLLSGRVLSSGPALGARLVSRVVPDGEALQATIGIAEAMVARFPDSRDFRKQRILRLSGLPLVTAMGLAREA